MPDAARTTAEPATIGDRTGGRGRLKIFLGAASGVGKTWEMLSDGGERLRAGADVVAALVVTHGRAEAEALLAPFEVMPRIGGEVRGAAGLDLDALIARKPSLALVDELSHVNTPGGRHPRRWQDVAEILDAGIDVYTTLNIQHVESLADVVAGFTRVAVDDTVPDSVFEHAEVEVVDLPPDELIRRLEEGKVHVSDEASRALGHYFSVPILSALRELVFRRAAQSVDRQMLEHLDANALPGTYAGGERVLVAVNELPGGDRLVRAAKRLADALHARWDAIYIDTPRARTFGEAQKRRVADALRLAATLGATIATVPAETVTEGLVAQVETLRTTQLVIGKSRRSWWFTLRHGSVVDKMMRSSEGLAVHVLPGGVADKAAPVAAVPQPSRWGSPGDYGLVAVMLFLTTGVGLLAERYIGLNAIDLLYLLPVIASAALFGQRPGLVAGLAAALAYNFFFIAPRGGLTVTDPQAIIALVVLLAISAFTSRLTERLRTRATLGLKSAHENAAVAAFAQTLARVSDRGSTAAVICHEVARLLDVETMLLAERAGVLATVASVPDGLTLGPVDAAAADWVWQKGEPAGTGTATMNAADWLFVPLKTSLGTLAVLGLAREDGRDPVPADRAVLMSAMVGQAALAHERIHLEDDVRDVSMLKDRDRTRVALLSSVGRDLAAPLAEMSEALGEASAAGPASPSLERARRGAERMRRFLTDIADMVGVEEGTIAPRPEPLDLVEVVGEAAHELHDLLRDVAVDLDVPAKLPRVLADQRVLHHILVNLMASAAQRGAPTIHVEGRRTPDAVTLQVADAGVEGSETVPTRRAGGEMGAQGGLGLAIVRGFADALGVDVAVAQGGEGRTVTLSFPAALIETGGKPA